MKKKNDEFELLKDLPEAARDPEIKAEDFELVATDTTIHEQKFQTKPTTFFRDCLRRFRKNKSSVVATCILGVLLLLAIIVPIASPYDVSADATNLDFEYLEPKLFDAGTGFWDGTRRYENYSVDVSAKPDAKTEEEKQEYWWPNKTFFRESAISKKEFSDETYINSISDYGKDGFIRHTLVKDMKDDYAELSTQIIEEELDLTTTSIKITSFDTYDLDKINLLPKEEAQPLDSNYTLTEAGLYLVAIDEDSEDPTKEVKTYYEIVEPKMTQDIGSAVLSKKTAAVDVATALAQHGETRTSFKKYYFTVGIENKHENKNKCTLIKSLVFDVSGNEEIKSMLCDYEKVVDEQTVQNNGASFTDASSSFREEPEDKYDKNKPNYAYLTHNSNRGKGIFMSKTYLVSFVYDTYEAKLGTRLTTVSYSDLKAYSRAHVSTRNKWGKKLMNINIDITDEGGAWHVDESTFICEILEPELCPLAKNLTIDDIWVHPDGDGFIIEGYVTMYKYYGYSTMPKFILGTDKNGKDMFKYVFDGLRWSLLLGIISSAVCFVFGLIWGAICGYFGGNVDLIMERFTDILSGIPWIVVMTLVIIHLGSNFVSFAIALCLTGWIGTAATTRTQFYRFRSREYVLASRTLGASDARLISKHILPNAMGTIITSAVLMIPSVIFSEATISYLGLGFKNLSSLGVILSNNQTELQQYPYLLIFPAVIIALLMISFNLFGNGLRDAVNPSLKGEGE